MNELKYLNDNFGHEAGDNALVTLADIFENSINSSTMCVYRLSGDEFLILMYQGKKDSLDNVYNLIKSRMTETEYSIAMGSYQYEKDSGVTYKEALKKDEELMYKDKERHYLESGHDRRNISVA